MFPSCSTDSIKETTVADDRFAGAKLDQCSNSVERMKPTDNGHKKPRAYSKHGLVTLKQAFKALGGRVIDKRTMLGKSLAKWRADLISDLGGADHISTQQSALVDLAVRSKLLLDSIDAWLLIQPSHVNARKRSLLPVVLQRQTLADGLARYLGQLDAASKGKVAQ